MNTKAPDLASVKQWSAETGEPAWTAYRMVEKKVIPHIRCGERSIKILMKPYRRMMNGEPIDAGLLTGRPLTIERTESETP